jgi:hypothetical protein
MAGDTCADPRAQSAGGAGRETTVESRRRVFSGPALGRDPTAGGGL